LTPYELLHQVTDLAQAQNQIAAKLAAQSDSIDAAKKIYDLLVQATEKKDKRKPQRRDKSDQKQEKTTINRIKLEGIF